MTRRCWVFLMIFYAVQTVPLTWAGVRVLPRILTCTDGGGMDWLDGRLRWSWIQAPDPTAIGFALHCGKIPGIYLISRTFPLTQLDVALTTMFPLPGPYCCVVAPRYAWGQGTLSEPFVFRQRLATDLVAPNAPTGVTIR